MIDGLTLSSCSYDMRSVGTCSSVDDMDGCKIVVPGQITCSSAVDASDPSSGIYHEMHKRGWTFGKNSGACIASTLHRRVYQNSSLMWQPMVCSFSLSFFSCSPFTHSTRPSCSSCSTYIAPGLRVPRDEVHTRNHERSHGSVALCENSERSPKHFLGQVPKLRNSGPSGVRLLGRVTLLS